MRILIAIASQQKGFFIGLGRRLAEMGHLVRFVPRDKDVADLIRRLAPELSDGIIESDDANTLVPPSDAIRRGLEVEDRYGIRLSMLLSFDRALGRGYIFNADRYPMIGRANWGHERKLAHILQRFIHFEDLLLKYQPDLVIGIQKDEVHNVVAASRSVPYLSPSPVKLGNRFMWSDNPFITSTKFLRCLQKNARGSVNELTPVGSYDQEAGSKYNHARVRFTWTSSIKEVLRNVYGELKVWVRGRRKKDSYPPFGWIPYLLRQPSSYRFFLRHGIRPDELRGRRAVYVPLHLEPEIALLALSPEFNNSMEMIAWISKSLPADGLVVVKEQPLAFGIRSRRYYQQLMQIGNVVLAHPGTGSWDWIRAATVTATITGTAATEAVMFGRPVLSFGRHQAVNFLPTVRFAAHYESTRKALDELLLLDRKDPAFELSRRALYQAQLECSFEMPGFEKTYDSSDIHDGLAEAAIKGLIDAIPGLMDTKRSDSDIFSADSTVRLSN